MAAYGTQRQSLLGALHTTALTEPADPIEVEKMSSYLWPMNTTPNDISALVALRQLATVTGTHAPSLFRLLRALTAFGVFDEVVPGRFTLTPIGDGVRADAPHSLRDAVLMWCSENY